MALSRQGKAWHSTIPYPQKRRGCLGQASRLDTMKDSGRGRWVSTRGAPASTQTTPQAPRGLPPPPRHGTGQGRDAPARTPLAARHHRRVRRPFPDGSRRERLRGARASAPASAGQEERSQGEDGRDGTRPTPHRPAAPTPRRTGGTPPGVFKPPRRNALGTWRRGGRRSWGEGEAVQAAREDDGGETG